VWSREISDKTRLMFGRMRYTDTSSGTRQSGGDVMLHQRVSTLHTHATIDVRHASDVINEASPDLYLAWAQGATEDPTPRQYMMRMTPTSGDMWRATVLRVLRESGTGPDPGAASATSAVFTGFTFASVRGPRGDDDDTLQLHLMDPFDARREVIDIPELGKGDVINVGITYDPYNGDIFILANGSTDQLLGMITYQWPIRQFTAWADVTAEGVISDSLSMKAGTSGKKVEGVYGIIAGGDRTVRHEIFATVNTIPSQPTWLIGGGAKNRNASLEVGPWQHVDVDGDSQTAYTLERRVNGDTEEYWNGINWQAATVNITSAADSVTLSSGWASAGDTVEFRVRTSDGTGFGPWSAALVIIAASPVNPTILSPADEASVTVPELVVEWDVAEQSAYLVELKTGDGTGTLWSSEWVGLAAPRSIEVPVDLEDGATYDVEVTTQNLVGLTSSTVKHDISVSLTPPPKPLFTWTAIPDQGAIDVIINNGTAGGGEADADSNDIYQVLDGVERAVAVNVEANGTFRDRDVAADVVIDYLIVARTAVGATKRSDA
jgi:hypothetical protein